MCIKIKFVKVQREMKCDTGDAVRMQINANEAMT